MPDYSKSKIYKLVSNQTNKIYIGSTCNDLRKRKSEHIRSFQKWKNNDIGTSKGYCSSFEIVKHDDVQIILIEKVICKDRDELKALERHYIEYNLNCVNLNIPNRTIKEYKKYYSNTTKGRKVKQENDKQYRIKNSEVIKEKKKQQYIKDKEMILKRQLAKVKCICGKEISYGYKKKHTFSNVHKKQMLLFLSKVNEEKSRLQNVSF
ncbi:TPA_asm: gIY-YIG [Monosiga MELD virus 2]|nr:TPA_asm: gIY-YIG [Monosiga MELD virus 2]